MRSFLIDVVVTEGYLLTSAPKLLTIILLIFQLVYHSSIIGAVELNCDLLLILTKPMRLANIATFAHLLQVIVETQTLIM